MLTDPIRILCVDDHRIVRDGLALILQLQPDLKVVATAATGEEGVMLFGRHRPDVTLMDLQLPRMTGIEAIAAIRRIDRDARIIALTVHQGDEDIHRALEAGANSYVLKDVLVDDLVRFIRQVHRGEKPIPSKVAESLSERASQSSLTSREVQVLELVYKGLGTQEIATSLSVGAETVYVHMKNIFAKLNVHDRTAAVRVGLRRGIIHLS